MKTKLTLSLLSCLTLASCSSGYTPTYGTGKTQEQALFETLTSIPLLTQRGEDDTINYTSRAELITPPTTNTLPTPLNQPAIADNFPLDPEAERAEIIEAIKQAEDANEPLPENIQAIRKAELERAKQRSQNAQTQNQNITTPTKPKKSFWKRLRESFSNKEKEEDKILIIDANDPAQVAAIQAPKRTSLRQPPSKYRTPEATAPIGDVGTPEIDLEKAKADQAKKDEGSIFDIFKRKKKDGDEKEEVENENEESAENTNEDTSAKDSNFKSEIKGLY